MQPDSRRRGAKAAMCVCLGTEIETCFIALRLLDPRTVELSHTRAHVVPEYGSLCGYVSGRDRDLQLGAWMDSDSVPEVMAAVNTLSSFIALQKDIVERLTTTKGSIMALFKARVHVVSPPGSRPLLLLVLLLLFLVLLSMLLLLSGYMERAHIHYLIKDWR